MYIPIILFYNFLTITVAWSGKLFVTQAQPKQRNMRHACRLLKNPFIFEKIKDNYITRSN